MKESKKWQRTKWPILLTLCSMYTKLITLLINTLIILQGRYDYFIHLTDGRDNIKIRNSSLSIVYDEQSHGCSEPELICDLGCQHCPILLSKGLILWEAHFGLQTLLKMITVDHLVWQ